MTNPRETFFSVPSVEALRALSTQPLPLGLGSPEARRYFFRDVYLDTAERALRTRGISCRYRVGDDGRRQLTLFLSAIQVSDAPEREQVDADVTDADPLVAARGNSEPARRLRAIVDPASLAVAYAVHTERLTRQTARGWLGGGQYEFAYDAATVEHSGITRPFQEVRVRRLRAGSPSLADIASALVSTNELRLILTSRLEREWSIASGMDREANRRGLASGHAIMLIAIDRGGIACLSDSGSLRLPSAPGSGIGACRHLMLSTFGSSVGELRLLGELPASDGRPHIEVWFAAHVRMGERPNGAAPLLWLSLEALIARAGSASLSDPHTLAALLLAARSDLNALTRSSKAIPIPDAEARPDAAPTSPSGDEEEGLGDGDRLLDGERSLHEFNARVLAMAEDRRTPLLERLQFLAIVSANNDEFFAVRVAALQRLRVDIKAEEQSRSAEQRTNALAVHVRALGKRQEACYRECMRELEKYGIRIVPWNQLSSDATAKLREHFRQVVFPALTPQAVTEAPGYPRPFVASFALSLAVMVKDPQTGPLHLTYVRVPAALPRLIPLGDSGSYVLLEDLIRDRLDSLYPGRSVLQAYVFRVTRSGELGGEEDPSVDLLQVIDEDTKRRWSNDVVRVEVEHAMPASMRTALIDELRFDGGDDLLPLGHDDIYDVEGPLDLTVLREVASPPVDALRFPPFHPRAPFPADQSLFSIIQERDQIVHHPYDSFVQSVQRFIEEAADDPDVTTIKLTLYRAGERSAIVDAAVRGAAAGKDVTAFVELKARFDEERNVRWAQQLRASGVHVVHGLAGLKTHSKLALVVRREGDTLRRYVHVGTGNYNAGTAKVYTDLGLFSADESLTADVSDLFNELTGSSEHPRGQYRRLLVAPHALLPALLARVDREAQHARDGAPSGIRLKINGLSDSELIDALYRASQAGVDIELIVRGVCRLRPGVPGMSERIRVLSILGRYLEHGRIYRFTNGGDPEYFIGSADWRPRNLRRRVETVAAVLDPACRAKLDLVLDRELADASAWELMSNGGYHRAENAHTEPGSSSQMMFAAEAQLDASGATVTA